VLRPYRDVLSTPGALAFSAAGFVARMPISMLGIGIVLLISGRTGAYAMAGAVAATFNIVQAIAAPQVARLVDRFGQARIMRPAVVLHATGVLLLVLAVESGAPKWTLFGAAVLAGLCMGSIGALVRTRWTNVLGEGDRLHTAFSLESVLDELVFIVGPVLVTLLATRVFPPAGLLAAATAGLLGGLTFTLLRRTEPPATRHHGASGPAILRIPGMAVLLATFVFVGGIFGSTEVVAVAFTDEHGRPAAAGLVLAAFAGGSMLSGIAYGAVQWRSPAGRRFLYGVVLLAVGVIPFAIATTIPLLAGVMFIAGFAISPMIIAGNALVQTIVPPRRLTEGLTWVVTALGIGTSMSAAVAGWAIDAAGAHRAFLVTVGCGALAAVSVFLGAGSLRRGEQSPGARPAPAPGAPVTGSTDVADVAALR
jgi:MFS family permease